MTMKIIAIIVFLFFSVITPVCAESNDAEIIKAIEVARKDFQDRSIAMYPSSGEYSILRRLDSYSMGVAEINNKVVVVFLVDRRLGFIGGGGEYTLDKKDGKVLIFQGYE